MSTGSFENWAGEIAEIGAIYPFEGTETILVIVGVVFWIWWHIKQIADEKRELEEVEAQLKDKEKLRELIEKEHTGNV
ncbi:MAG: hypothetical protein AAF434_19780 [Pseudomonadota bacterium]